MDRLDTLGLAKKNIKNKASRTYPMILLTAILCFVIFLSSFLIISLKNGIGSLANRMGADIIVVPEGYDSKITGAILRGEPNSFFFDKSVAERVSKIDGVEKVSPQLYLATLSAGCCSFPIQIIGVDLKDDFIVGAWLTSRIDNKLADNEVIAGYNIQGNHNSEVKFFNQGFKIKAKLDKTGMGFDESVFMSMEQTRKLAKEYEKILNLPIADNDNLISSVMVKLKKDADPVTVLKNIRTEFQSEGVYALLSKQMMSEVSSNMKNILIYVYILMGVLWIMVLLVLGIVYNFSIKERKREFATLRILGATKRKLMNIVLSEVYIINFIGAIIGTVLGLSIAMLFGPAISLSLKLPFLEPGFMQMIYLSLASLLVGIFIGPMAASFALNKMYKTELALLLKENE